MRRNDRAAWTAHVMGGKEKKTPKYNNVKTDGYDSKREADRGKHLEILQKIGEISNLRRQVKVELIPKQKGEQACSWQADFMYNETESGEEIWEDCKGFRTPVYRIKKKIVLYRYGKVIRET